MAALSSIPPPPPQPPPRVALVARLMDNLHRGITVPQLYSAADLQYWEQQLVEETSLFETRHQVRRSRGPSGIWCNLQGEGSQSYSSVCVCTSLYDSHLSTLTITPTTALTTYAAGRVPRLLAPAGD